MQWSSSRTSRAATLGTLLLAVACVTVTTRSFLPSPQNPLYTPANAEPVLRDYLRLQCEPLRKAQRPDSGTARFAVEVDSAGFARRAELQQGTGDETLDGVFGTVTAQLTFPPGKARREVVDLAWECRGDSAHVAVRTAGR